MKYFFVILFWLAAAGFAAEEVDAQKKTIILVRHAEKETSAGADPNDPPLSAEGRERAQRLVKKIGKYRPGAVYSTGFKRTQETAAPIAAKRKKQVETYDPRNQQALVDRIMQSRTKRFVIVGHSNTIPGLANLITKKELFKNLEDAEHSVIWVIRLRRDQPPRVEILTY